ncbi:serine hydrolase domain-containing protein [Agromyces sp. NPDC004153]
MSSGAAAAAPGPVEAGAMPAWADAAYDPEWATASELEGFLRAKADELRLAGLAVVVLAEDEVLFEGTYGEAAPDGRPVTLDTPFVLGSTSKQFTALAVQQLVAQDRLGPDDTIGSLLFELGGDASALASVTVEQLLEHTSGLTMRAGLDFFSLWPQAGSIEEDARRLLREQPEVEPGTRFEYTNANYTLLGAIIEAATGETYESAMQELVVDPLGLEATTSDLDRAAADGLAIGEYTWFRLLNVTTPTPVTAAAAPSGYLTSNAHDLTRLVEAHLGTSTGIDPDVLEAARRPLTEIDRYAGYASGWYQRAFWELTEFDAGWEDPDLPRIWEHGGDALRAMSYIAIAPDLGFGVVVLTNTGLGSDQGRFAGFTNALLHEIVGTRAAPVSTDPLIAAAPAIMIGMPLLLAAAIAWVVLVLRRPPASRIARWLPVAVTAVLVALTLWIAFVVVPASTRASLIDTWWWSGAPDLAVSIGLSLLLTACVVPLLVAQVVAASRRREPGSSPDQYRSGDGVEA